MHVSVNLMLFHINPSQVTSCLFWRVSAAFVDVCSIHICNFYGQRLCTYSLVELYKIKARMKVTFMSHERHHAAHYCL